jgi:hypothetical protein
VTAISHASVATYTIPTEEPESDGTLEWTSTTMVLVEVRAGETMGVGYTYGHRATAAIALVGGAPEPVAGMLRPDRSRPGLGLELKRADASRYAA